MHRKIQDVNRRTERIKQRSTPVFVIYSLEAAQHLLELRSPHECLVLLSDRLLLCFTLGACHPTSLARARHPHACRKRSRVRGRIYTSSGREGGHRRCR
jgi:hypothetical protein